MASDAAPEPGKPQPTPGVRPGVWILALAILAGLAWALATAERPPAPVRTGAPAPDFTLPTLAGGEASLGALRGKVVLVNFWATWCKPCEDEMPAMQRLYQELAPQGFELLAVSVDDDRAAVEEFKERLGLTFPILLDPEKKVSREYQSLRFPESFLVDREGVLVARYVGPREWDAALYRERVRKLIAGQP